MKKLLLVCVLAFAIAGSASALPNYIWNVGGYNDAGGSGAYTFFGKQATASTALISVGASSAAVASLGYTGGLDASLVKTALYSKNFVAGDPTSFALQAWAGPDFVGETISVRVWANTTASIVPAAGWTLYKLYDPISQTWGRTALGVIPIGAASGTSNAPWFQTSLPVFKTGSPLNEGQGYVLEMSSYIPEPGSMIAVLSGLVGLVGFGIRRKR